MSIPGYGKKWGPHRLDKDPQDGGRRKYSESVWEPRTSPWSTCLPLYLSPSHLPIHPPTHTSLRPSCLSSPSASGHTVPQRSLHFPSSVLLTLLSPLLFLSHSTCQAPVQLFLLLAASPCAQQDDCCFLLCAPFQNFRALQFKKAHIY